MSDRVTDSPIDLKLDLFNPAIKRLHIDIPARPIPLPGPAAVPPPLAGSFDQHSAAFGSSGQHADDAASTTARDLSVDRNGPTTGPGSAVPTAPAIGQSAGTLHLSDAGRSVTTQAAQDPRNWRDIG